jgi:hypothetical protein
MFATVVNEQYLVGVLPLMALRYQKTALILSSIAVVFSMFNAFPVYFAMPLLYELNLSGFVTSFFEFAGTAPIFAIRSLILFCLGLYFFLRSFDLINSVLRKRSQIQLTEVSRVTFDRPLGPQQLLQPEEFRGGNSGSKYTLDGA